MADNRNDALVERREFFFPSSCAGVSIHAVRWSSENALQNPKGIVQIIHGMEEHIDRYDEFARFLAQEGYLVYGSSHIGHGKSVSEAFGLSNLPENGAQVMIADVHELRRIASSECPSGVPYFMFGHSMGSFVLRAYLARYGRGLAGAVVCGTGQQPIIVSKAAAWLSRRIGRRKGFDSVSTLIDQLAMGGYSKAVKNARTPFDWLSVDESVVDAYIADPACGKIFSVGGYASLTDLTGEVASKRCAASVPEGLPVLFIAGSEDPVGGMGKGVQAAADAMKSNSKACVSVTIYDGMRHEVLNEPGKSRVFNDVSEFFGQIVGKANR